MRWSVRIHIESRLEFGDRILCSRRNPELLEFSITLHNEVDIESVLLDVVTDFWSRNGWIEVRIKAETRGVYRSVLLERGEKSTNESWSQRDLRWSHDPDPEWEVHRLTGPARTVNGIKEWKIRGKVVRSLTLLLGGQESIENYVQSRTDIDAVLELHWAKVISLDREVVENLVLMKDAVEK